MKESCGQQQAEEQKEVATIHIDAVADHDGHRKTVMKAVPPIMER